MAEALRVAQQGLGVRKHVMAHRDWLRALDVREAGHHPRGVVCGTQGERVHCSGDSINQRAGRRASV